MPAAEIETGSKRVPVDKDFSYGYDDPRTVTVEGARPSGMCERDGIALPPAAPILPGRRKPRGHRTNI